MLLSMKRLNLNLGPASVVTVSGGLKVCFVQPTYSPVFVSGEVRVQKEIPGLNH